MRSHAVADLYILVFGNTLASNEIGHGLEGYYVGENGEMKFGGVSKAVGEAMVKVGKSASAEPTPFTDEEMKKYYRVCIAWPDFPSFAERCHAGYLSCHKLSCAR